MRPASARRLLSDDVTPLPACQHWHTDAPDCPDWRALDRVGRRWLAKGWPVNWRVGIVADPERRHEYVTVRAANLAVLNRYIHEVRLGEALLGAGDRCPPVPIPEIVASASPPWLIIYPAAPERLLSMLAESWWPGWSVEVHDGEAKPGRHQCAKTVRIVSDLSSMAVTRTLIATGATPPE